MARPRHELALWHTSYTSNGTAISSNQRPAADGAGNVVWSAVTGSVSFGSNATSVSVTPAGGASSDASRSDHVHDLIAPIVSLGNIAASQSLDLSTGDTFAGTLVQNSTFSFANPDASGLRDDFTVELTEDGTGGWSPTWPGAVAWIGGVTPTHITTASSTSVYGFYTRDGGTTYRGFQAAGSLSYASNSNQVSTANGPGASALVSRADHVHLGVASVSHTSNTFSGPITLVAQGTTGITSPSAGTFAINSGAGSGSGSGDFAGKELDYAELTAASTNVTATTEGTANTLITGTAVTYDGQPVMVHVYIPDNTPPSSAGVAITIWLYEDGSSIGQMGLHLAPASAADRKPDNFWRRITPSAGSHTYSARGTVGSGTGVVRAGPGGAGQQAPAFLRITKV